MTDPIVEELSGRFHQHDDDGVIRLDICCGECGTGFCVPLTKRGDWTGLCPACWSVMEIGVLSNSWRIFREQSGLVKAH